MARVNRGKAVQRRKRGVVSWCVYLLRCADGTLYAGATNHVERRLGAHGRGQVKYTRGRLPVVLAWVEEVGAWGAALSREAGVKRLTRAGKEVLVRKWDGHVPVRR